MKFETVRSRLFYRSLDAAMTASLRADRGFTASLGSVLDPHASRYVRVGSLVNLFDAILPGTVRRSLRFLQQARDLPFLRGPLRLFDYGSGSTVFLLENDPDLWVLKIYRRSLGRSLESLPVQALEYLAKYETVSGWYGANIVWPAAFLILHGPLLRSPAVACLQRFLVGEKKDLFEEFSDDELRHLFEEDHVLKAQFVHFARKALDVHTTKGRCVDFLGRRNCLLVRDGGSLRLRLIDYGIFDMAELKHRSPSVFYQVESRMTRLRGLLKKVAPHPEKVTAVDLEMEPRW